MLVLCTAAVAGCDGDSSPSSPPPSGSAETVTGRERVGWIQTSVSASDMMVLQFAAYVDGSRRVLEGFTCSPSSGDTLRMLGAAAPAQRRPAHVRDRELLQLRAPAWSRARESPPLQLMVSASSRNRRLAASSDGTFAASDGRELHAQVLADDLVDPVDVAVDARGRAFVVERRGTLRIIDADSSCDDGRTLEPLFGARDEGSQAPCRLRSLRTSPARSDLHLERATVGEWRAALRHALP